MEFLYTVVFPALATILTGLAGWGITVLVAWLNTKIKNENVRTALRNTRDIITAAVSETAQTFVDDLKRTDSFSDALKAEAFARTLHCVKAQLTAEATKLIQTTPNDLDAWLTAEIEKAVKNSKAGG